MLGQLFSPRHARFRWLAVLPAAAALVFAGLAYQDMGLGSASPYLVMAALCGSYAVRPSLALWVLPFAGFTGYTAVMLVAPLVGYGGGPVRDWFVFFGLGIVPAVLLWLARPRA